MANKKVEDKNKKNQKKVSAKRKEKDEVVVEVEKVVCEECGNKYSADLNECPKCGYSLLAGVNKKTFYDDEEDFEDYDDEDEEISNTKVKSEKSDVTKLKETTKKEEKNKKEETVKPINKKEENKKKDKNANKRVSIENKKSMLSDDTNEIFNFIKILVVIVFLVVIVWLVASLMNKENSNDKLDGTDDKDVIVSIQNDKILASSIFNKKDKTYYVFVYDASKDNDWAEYYERLFLDYDVIEDKDKEPMFWVDLNDPLNASIVVEDKKDQNTKPSKYENLRVYGPTLIKIKKGKLDKYYTGDDAIDKLIKMIDSYRDKEEK